ncbi:uncharacterized protein F4822DRAFT_428317 [Hypoxylon trugodes]|uniref:uncharacterized protein n=1 Tax=Hypoxylon trugodes TaxID=326681 RepID=UPI00218E765E|nr:uncharacterized protein F4822DRAFT_428317 [Hypoxylon trugodes]KAI1389970.1 hypothetical protein F4822DRAFT_428317 [Hypoxylon trugodes]
MAEVHRIGLTQLSKEKENGEEAFQVNVVFIHGLNGHPKDTWTDHRPVGDTGQPRRKRWKWKSDRLSKAQYASGSNEPSGKEVFWPRDFLVPDWPEARVWTYGYNADIISGLFQANSKNSISQHDQDLANSLSFYFQYEEPIIFVAHSLGGVLVKDDVFVKLLENCDTKNTVCILDAFDECEEQGRRRLTAALCELYDSRPSMSSSSIKFLLTSRPYSPIQRGFQVLENKMRIIHLNGENEEEVDKICQEIDIVITARLDNVTGKLQLSRAQRYLLQQELTRTPHRTYLWVYLIFEMIEDITWITEDDLLSSIRKLPKTVEAAYEKILYRCRDQVLAKHILRIVVTAERPLSLKEMAMTLTIREHHRKLGEIKLQTEEVFRKTIRDICGLFVTIVDSRIYLLHQTARELLIRRQPPGGFDHRPDNFWWGFSFELVLSHHSLAETCIRQLLLEDFKFPLPEGHAVKYASEYWLTHWQRAQIEDDAPIQQLLFRLFSKFRL